MNNCYSGSLVSIFLSLLNAAQMQVLERKQWNGAGTTPNLESIVTGRCYDYMEIVNPTVSNKNCSAIWEALKLAFVNKDPCSVLPSDYELLINLTSHEIPPNKSLFWENNKLLVYRYASKGLRYMTLGDILTGWIVDDLNWCGKPSDSGIDYVSCPTTEECEQNPVESFWRIASMTIRYSYAKQSSGVIRTMLNGSATGGAFPIKSFFADYELPNFQKSSVSHFEIWVMDDIEGTDLDSCGRGSIKMLEDILISKGFNYTCTDNYRPVRALQCVDFPRHPECAITGDGTVIQPWMTLFLPWLIMLSNCGQICFRGASPKSGTISNNTPSFPFSKSNVNHVKAKYIF
ncbi:ADP-ribosyl cyclase/cyclic ADP-ribose hydrolase 2-like [Rhinatrema bivittatum]|uniref:ADP-ribosyl cyclase/cyclic ADP-ribose hydrolase 2-like n=1 Tax=Rhinatrema bivittatum TaxID=194408 RepID=UPI00112656A7|nr:ADP-ribosyl cyclase/cyclic ADP-ribose hydrolase 2-like [Rhinatrema bivittatum]